MPGRRAEPFGASSSDGRSDVLRTPTGKVHDVRAAGAPDVRAGSLRWRRWTRTRRAQHAAEHKAAALHHVGRETGAGATIWAQAVRDVLALHESARERFGTKEGGDKETWDRLHGAALMVVVAIDQVLAFEQRVRRLTDDDPELVEARARFDAVCPDAEMLRDIVTHLDAYAVGEGWRQTGARKPPLNERYVRRRRRWSALERPTPPPPPPGS